MVVYAGFSYFGVEEMHLVQLVGRENRI